MHPSLQNPGVGLLHRFCILEKLFEKRELKITGAFVNTFLLLADVKNVDVLTSLNALGGMRPTPCLRGWEEAELSSIYNLLGFEWFRVKAKTPNINSSPSSISRN